MAYIDWEDAYSVGIRAFDDDHRRLVAYVNELHMGLLSGGKVSAMTTILEGLADYTAKHFRREEELMKKHSYPAYDEHKKAHMALMEKVNHYKSQLAAGKTSFSLELMNFLRDWLVNHILGVDMKYRDFFAGKGVS